MLNSIPPDAQERAYQWIRAQILALRYRGNQRLRAGDISVELEISRTPVREALGRLVHEGLVEKDGGWGYMVKAFSLAEFLNLFKVRDTLEVEALHEAFPNLTDSVIKTLEDSLARAAEALQKRDIVTFLGVNRDFHQTIAEAASNPILKRMLDSIADRIRMGGAMVIQQYGARAEEILDENQKILSAIKKQDLSLAESALRAHIRRAKETVMDHVGRDPGKLFMAA